MLVGKEFTLLLNSVLSHSRTSLKIDLLTNMEVISYTRIFNGSTLTRPCHLYKKPREVNIKTLELFLQRN